VAEAGFIAGAAWLREQDRDRLHIATAALRSANDTITTREAIAIALHQLDSSLGGKP
jgi:hypothetical protein